jgi:hypothetical protein
MRDRLRQRALISLLKTHDGPPTILANQIYFLHDVVPHLDNITDKMTVEQVVVTVGTILRSKQRLHEDVTAWARNLFEQAGLPFTPGGIEHEETVEPSPALSVVPFQSATPMNPITPAPPKRKSRRVYLELAISLLERGSFTHRGLVDAIMEQYPTLNRETVSTFVSDVQNPKYSPIKGRSVVKLPPDGKLVFEDKIKPTLTVIENPDYARTEEEPVTEAGKNAILSGSDL